MKYITEKIGNLITRISLETDTKGYTVGMLEPFFLSDEEMNLMTDEQVDTWVEQNNKRMIAVCNHLNEIQL